MEIARPQCHLSHRGEEEERHAGAAGKEQVRRSQNQ